MADLIAGLIALLKADAGVAAIAGAEVFGGELPARLAPLMPKPALVAVHSGGTSLTGGSYAEHDTVRVDLFAYGPTPAEAMRLLTAGALALRRARRKVWGNVLIHWASPASGPLPSRDAALAWPRAFQSFQVMHALEPVGSGP